MKKFLNFFISLTLVLLISGCGSTKPIENSYGQSLRTELIGQQVTKSQKYVFKRTDFNSFCNQRGITTNLSDWYPAAFKDYETGKVIREFVITEDKDASDNISSDVYRTRLTINGSDTTFVVIHRNTIRK